MYRVIIIDDEEIVRKGLKDLIDWNAAGFEICAEGIDGRDGLGKILHYQPQLVLVDIKMPGLSGIEVVCEARKEQFEGHFIILTGYSEFEFAKSAISLGVKEYLLKPVNTKELIRIINDIYNELQKQEELQKVVKEDLLRRIIFNKDEREVLESQVKLYDLELNKKPYCVVILSEIEHNDEVWHTESINEFLLGCGIGTEKVIIDGDMVLVCCGKHYNQLVEILHKINIKVNNKFDRSYRISVGHDVMNWYDLCFSYEFARYLMENDFLFCDLLVVSPDSIGNYSKESENNSIEYLRTLLEIGDLDGIHEYVKRYKKFCIRQLFKESEIKAQLIYHVVLLKEQLLRKYKADEDTEKKVEYMLEQMISTKGFGQLMEIYSGFLELICKQIVQNDSGSVVKRILRYMENNYKENIKLKDIARLFHYNSTYLGTVFKEETGEIFKNALDMIRITQAKRMLFETDFKIYRIAEEVGYSDLDNFYTIFKKHVGVSPKEYKKTVNA